MSYYIRKRNDTQSQIENWKISGYCAETELSFGGFIRRQPDGFRLEFAVSNAFGRLFLTPANELVSDNQHVFRNIENQKFGHFVQIG